MTDIYNEISIELIDINPFQPRKHFSHEELEELANSIKSVGILHPPLVRPVNNRYEIISGERRFRAAQLAGFKKMPVLIRKTISEISAQAALIENIQRVDLNPMEIAKAMRQLIDEFAYSQEELALKIGKKRSTIANYIRLLTLPKVIQTSVSNNQISMGHAKAILSLETQDQQVLLLEIVLRDQLTVRETEETALKLADKAKKRKLIYQTQDFYLSFLEEKMQQALGTKVSITSSGKKGKILIDYYSLDDLDRLLKIFRVEVD
ncbi:MAG: chromosome partitioning protein [Chlamydia sp. 32-24]|nr:MAG: chromosome partitioning protein [Chlamydia sp. 32-24]